MFVGEEIIESKALPDVIGSFRRCVSLLLVRSLKIVMCDRASGAKT
jgi:hypothetical protein